MRIKPKEVNRKVNLLVDPNPSFMSLVDNGANQTPWNAVKRDKVTTTKEKHVMAANNAGKGSKRRGFLQKMQFSKSKFATQKSVKKFLSDNGIEGYDGIKDGDDVWIVKSTEDATQFKLGKAAATPGLEDGVTAFISPIIDKKAEEPEDDEEEDEQEEAEDGDEDGDEEDEDEDDKPAGKAKKGAASKVKTVDGIKTKKSVKKKPVAKGDDDEESDPLLELPPALAKKFDWWGAYVSGDTTLSGVLKDGSYDGMPPGLETVMQAAAFTIGNILTSDDDDDDKATSLKQVGSEMADFAFGLYGLFAKANEDSTKSVNKSVRQAATKFVDTFSESIASAAKSGTFDNVIEENDEDEEEAPKGKAKKAAPKKTAKTVEDDDADIATILRDAMAPVVKQIGEVAKRVDDMDKRSPSRKSMSESIDDIVGDDEEDEDEQIVTEKAADLRSAMGLPRARSNP